VPMFFVILETLTGAKSEQPDADSQPGEAASAETGGGEGH